MMFAQVEGGGAGSEIWQVDDQDTDNYTVMPSPGCTGIFWGCRGESYLSHIDQNGSRGVWVMFGGEVNGFSAMTTGPATTNAENTHLTYPWVQTGMDTLDPYSSGTVIDFGGGITGTLDEALLASSQAYEPLVTQRIEIPVGTHIHIRHLTTQPNPGGFFVFELAREAMVELCP